ncbi:hypothetical protein FJTKL_07777 [Diaporthe vaccinii]|uniref:Uncharacterized protein n=1 Tax=Diaporthe vaccinii TaxID=105482 RepID=A0ABR4FDC2_9PEZI
MQIKAKRKSRQDCSASCLTPCILLIGNPVHRLCRLVAIPHQTRDAVLLPVDKLILEPAPLRRPLQELRRVPHLDVEGPPLRSLGLGNLDDGREALGNVVVRAGLILHHEPEDVERVALDLVQAAVVAPRPHRPDPPAWLAEQGAPDRGRLVEDVFRHEVLAHQVPEELVELRHQCRAHLLVARREAPCLLLYLAPEQVLVQVAQHSEVVVAQRPRLGRRRRPSRRRNRLETKVGALECCPSSLGIEGLADVRVQHREQRARGPIFLVLVLLGALPPFGPLRQLRAQLLHHSRRVALAAVLWVGEDRGDPVCDAILHDRAIWTEPAGEGSLAQRLAACIDWSVVWGSIPICQDPVRNSSILCEGHRHQELLSCEIVLGLQRRSPHGMMEAPDMLQLSPG